jgi:hypothetical protein
MSEAGPCGRAALRARPLVRVPDRGSRGPVYAAVNLVSMYNDVIIAHASGRTLFDAPSPSAKHTALLHAATPTYRATAYTLAVVQAGELWVELFARKRWGDGPRWRVVLVLEMAKCDPRPPPPPPLRLQRTAPTQPHRRCDPCPWLRRTLCRLRLLQLSGGRMNPASPLPESTRSGGDLGALAGMLGLPTPAAPPSVPAVPGAADAGTWTGPRTGRVHATMGAVERASGGKRAASSAKAAADFVAAQAGVLAYGPAAVHARLDRVHLLAELVFALRPLLYGARRAQRQARPTLQRCLTPPTLACTRSDGDPAVRPALLEGLARGSGGGGRRPCAGTAADGTGRRRSDRGRATGKEDSSCACP